MARGSGSWLEGPGSARPVEAGFYPGKRLGMPETGPGSVASTGSRVAAILIDIVLASLVGAFIWTGIDRRSETLHAFSPYIAFIPMYVLLILTTGQTFGMRILKIGLAPVGRRYPWAFAVVLRTLLLSLLVPALIYDRDGRGLHDKIAGTVVVRA